MKGKEHGEMTPLFTDFYSLTMMQGYFVEKRNPTVVCDVFFRNQPFEGGFSVFCGLGTLMERLQQLRFKDEDIEYLREQKIFCEDFLRELKNFRFSGELFAMKEGSVCFPHEPLVRIHAPMIEALLIEALVLNTINHQTLIATKSARIMLSAKGKEVMEFGLRRAQGIDGALSASRAAFVGGASSTSNVRAGAAFGIPVAGTMSHAWVMSFPNEREAFEVYARLYPKKSAFLLDTYDTLESGLPNAIAVGKKLKENGNTCAVRIDSGDIEYLSHHIRKRLDDEGLQDARIVVSSDLDENIILELTSNQSPVDVWGVGTKMTTGAPSAAFTGVYKMCAIGKTPERAVMKISNHIQKSTLPCVKQVYRFSDAESGMFLADLIALENEAIEGNKEKTRQKEAEIMFYHPFIDKNYFSLRHPVEWRPLLRKMMDRGEISVHLPKLSEIRARVQRQLARLHKTSCRLLNPHTYHVSISQELKKKRDSFILRHRARGKKYSMLKR